MILPAGWMGLRDLAEATQGISGRAETRPTLSRLFLLGTVLRSIRYWPLLVLGS